MCFLRDVISWSTLLQIRRETGNVAIFKLLFKVRNTQKNIIIGYMKTTATLDQTTKSHYLLVGKIVLVASNLFIKVNGFHENGRYKEELTLCNWE